MYQQFNPTEYTPHGWLREQLRIQANGQAGNLDKIWPDVRDSGWIGGTREGWERAPYWLDGFIPLAYLLDEADMIARADRYVNAILDRQQPSGWICPCPEDKCETYDIWVIYLIGKVLALYYEFTGSERAKDGLYRAMANFHGLLSSGKISLAPVPHRSRWGETRWFEAFISLQFLYDEYHEEWILDLAKTLRRQGTHWPDLTELWKRPLNHWCYETHIVNIAMMLKYEAVSSQLLGEEYEGQADALWKILEQYNGTAVGCFTGDECLSGLANNQGTELCSIVDLMYSCELLYAATGNDIWAARLEKLAFNALPATISDDMWTHQYDQSVNQIACVRFPGKSFFRTNGPDAHLFGLEPHYGCCTANHGQGWPKLAMNVFLRDGDAILCALMLPAELNTKIGDAQVCVKNETEYPFRLSCRFTVETDRAVHFPLKIRIPQWAKGVRVNGESVEKQVFLEFDRTWTGSTEILVELIDTPRFVSRPHGLRCVEYGPLVFALPIEHESKMYEYEKNGVERKFPYCDYELYPKSEWRYGFCSQELTVCENEGDEIPFSSTHPRITIKTRCVPVDWDYADGYDTVAEKCPSSTQAVGEPEEKELYPYGCTRLRITESVYVK